MAEAEAFLSTAAPTFRAAGEGAVLTTELGDGIALLDLRANEYFTLNGVGAFLWRRLQAPQSKAELLSAVLAEYDTDPDRCASDIDAILGDLIAAKLVEVC